MALKGEYSHLGRFASWLSWQHIYIAVKILSLVSVLWFFACTALAFVLPALLMKAYAAVP